MFAAKLPLTPFTGRESELAAVVERREAAARGEGGVILVAGEPGIGKSRLLLEIQAFARAAGWLVLSGRAYDTEGMPPYLPFAEAIAQYLRITADDEASQQLPVVASEVALLVPELSQHLPEAVDRPLVGPDAARYRLFEAVADFFLRISATNEAPGLLLCLDDLHWADRSTLLLFQHLARKLPSSRLLVVGTYRTPDVGEDHPLAPILADLKRERLCESLGLDALSSVATATMVRLLTRRNELPPTFLQALFNRTNGNPFYVEEVIRHLQSEGRDFDDLGLASGDWGLPEGARQIIGSRLNRLSPEALRFLHAAAVLGDEFSLMFPVVGRMLAVEISALAEIMEDAIRAGLIRNEGEHYRFGHALIRDAILDQLSLPRRQSLHLCAAKAMEEVYARNVEAHLPALAVHHRLAGPFGEGEKAIDYSIRAGDAAERALAYEEARSHWEAALDLMERHDVETRETVRLVERLGELMQTVGFDNYAKSAAYFERAITLHEKLGDAAAAAAMYARLALLLAAGSVINDNPAALRHLRAAAPLLEDGLASDAQLSYFSALGLLAVWQIATDDGLAASTRAMEIALELGKKDRWVTNAVMRSYHLHALGRLGEGNALMTEAWESANHLNNTYRAFVAAGWLGDRLLELEDPLAARASYQKEVDQFRQAHAPTRHQSLQRSIATTFAYTGEMERCRTALAEAGISPGPLIPFWEAKWDQLEAFWMRAREAAPRGLNYSYQATADYWLARICRLRGDTAGAVGLLSEALAIGLEGPSLLIQMRVSAELAMLYAEKGQFLEAESHLERSRAILAFGEDWSGLAGRTMLAEAVTAAAGKRYDIAKGWFAHSVDCFRKLTLPWDEAEAHEIWARSCGHSLRGRTRRAFISTEFALARGIYQRIGAAPAWLERLDAEECRLVGPQVPGARPGLPDGLTQREAEVLRLAARGYSSRQVGEELVLSVRTVERHIANVYLKTGTHRRAQLTAYALRHGLTTYDS